MGKKTWTSTYAGAYRGGVASDASTFGVISRELRGPAAGDDASFGDDAKAAGIKTEKDNPGDRVGVIIKPGGALGDSHAGRLTEARKWYGAPFVGTPRDWAPARHSNVELVARAHSARAATHERCIAHVRPDEWGAALETEYGAMPRPDKMPKACRSSQHWRLRTREEHEDRWRSWQKRQSSRDGGPASRCTGVSASTAASTAPAGLRQAKALGQLYPGGVRLPLFGADKPAPVWTTLTDAPWARRPEVPEPPASDAENRWVSEYTAEHIPKRGQGPFGRFGASILATPRGPEPVPHAHGSYE
mmetsp:Transcript_78270/g.221286  ORF Transcript_78270/g.221286 Transcript_78270/m.221286 type:complete len:303 (+) Transcript_78270:48-956(+)